MDEQNRNLLIATSLSLVVIIIWFVVFSPDPPTAPTGADVTETGEQADPNVASAPTVGGSGVADFSLGSQDLPLEEALAKTKRIKIETSSLIGSISLLGGRIDDLSLTRYKETIKEDSEIVRLLSPPGASHAYYAMFGWAPAGQIGYQDVPNPGTEWQLETGTTLTPEAPVTLVWKNDFGLEFRRHIQVDENYLFTITQSVTNNSSSPVRMAPYGLIARHGEPANQQSFFILHEGVVRMSDGQLNEIDYGDVPDLTFDAAERANISKIDVQQNGWVGFTDKYWMMTLVPQPTTPFTSVAKYTASNDIFQTEARHPTLEVYPNSAIELQTMLFAGAKEWRTIKDYEEFYGIERFVDSIDWGWFFFLTKPIFAVLYWINGIIGNMGWSIIALTFVIKAALFPLAYKSYVSLARMKDLQPEMEKIKERVGDDRKQLQSEMMAMYREKKINPAAGCLPILPQIPIFFSLYKVIFVTIEMRHAPFILWIRDLSAPDPTSILNLFGALPWGAPDPGSLVSIISLGVLPILLGISMWLQQKLNPAPTDPTQAMVFAWLPWIFMFMLGQFASGLIIYWIANNTITFVQQYLIMRSQGVRPDVLGNIRAGIEKRRKASASASQQSAPKEEPKAQIQPDRKSGKKRPPKRNPRNRRKSKRGKR
ncbi:MAG: membrane protein insertase YidC [Rhodobacteraceae bacterium]|nr:membrane protein insertase YidC [Paracoccaceae bacterium]